MNEYLLTRISEAKTAMRGSGKRIGIERLSAHDLRRTQITLALNNGARLHDMQAQAGHANAATTLLYARPADAKSRRLRIPFCTATNSRQHSSCYIKHGILRESALRNWNNLSREHRSSRLG